MSTRGNVVKDALIEAEQIERLMIERAKSELYEAFAPAVKRGVSHALDEVVGTGKDQPSGYDPEEDQDALAYGSSRHSTAKKDDINKGGKGPQKLEASINVDEDYDTEDFGSDTTTDDDLDVVSVNEDFEDEDLDENSYEDEDLDETAEEDLDETEDKDDSVDETNHKDVDEGQKLAKENKSLKKELSEYKKAFGILKNKLDEVNLLNAKLSGAMRFVRNPSLTVKEKEVIVEAFDTAKNVREVKLIAQTFSKGSKISSARKPNINSSIKPVASKKLNEAFGDEFSRQRELAGI